MEVFGPNEISIVPVMDRVVRRCFLLGDDSVTGKNYDHRKAWIEDLLKRFADRFGIDLLGLAAQREGIEAVYGSPSFWVNRGAESGERKRPEASRKERVDRVEGVRLAKFLLVRFYSLLSPLNSLFLAAGRPKMEDSGLEPLTSCMP